jgi:hypothetical protein
MLFYSYNSGLTDATGKPSGLVGAEANSCLRPVFWRRPRRAEGETKSFSIRPLLPADISPPETRSTPPGNDDGAAVGVSRAPPTRPMPPIAIEPTAEVAAD